MTVDAYAAGLFDGEGTVGIRKGTTSYTLNVQFHMTNKEVLELLRSHYGGCAVHTCKRYPNRRQGYKWNLWCGGAAAFLLRIQPFLIVKKAEVETALAFQSINTRRQSPSGGFRKKTPEERLEQDSFYQKLAAMKRPA